MKKIASLASLSALANDTKNIESQLENQQDNLLTNDSIKKSRKNPLDDEFVMIGARFSKRQRRDMKKLAADLEISIQELLHQSVAMFRESKGHR